MFNDMCENSICCNTKSLVRISKIAEALKKSPAWIRKLGDRGDLDIISIDGLYFVKVNDKLRKMLPETKF